MANRYQYLVLLLLAAFLANMTLAQGDQKKDSDHHKDYYYCRDASHHQIQSVGGNPLGCLLPSAYCFL